MSRYRSSQREYNDRLNDAICNNPVCRVIGKVGLYSFMAIFWVLFAVGVLIFVMLSVEGVHEGYRAVTGKPLIEALDRRPIHQHRTRAR